jgi:hypothetical protein
VFSVPGIDGDQVSGTPGLARGAVNRVFEPARVAAERFQAFIDGSGVSGGKAGVRESIQP